MKNLHLKFTNNPLEFTNNILKMYFARQSGDRMSKLSWHCVFNNLMAGLNYKSPLSNKFARNSDYSAKCTVACGLSAKEFAHMQKSGRWHKASFQWPRQVWIMKKKTGGRKSRWTVPLKKGLCQYTSLFTFVRF